MAHDRIRFGRTSTGMSLPRPRHIWRETSTTLGRWKAVEVTEPVLSMDDLRWLWRMFRQAWARALRRYAGV
jgi:hypothetical protein